jgi:pimeloyl-ACP methyl ester carboxylesterase
MVALCEIHRLTERDDDGRLELQTPKQTLTIIGRETPGFVEPGVFCCPGLFTFMNSKNTQRIEMKSIEVEGRQVQYKVVGEGEPVVLVHGLSASSLWWKRNIPALAQQYRLYLVDLPGFGSLGYARHRFILTHAAAWLLRWMEGVGLQQAHFIGHSMGGYICLWIAAHHPEKVSSLVLISPAVSPGVHSVFAYLVPLVVSIRHLTPAFFPILAYDAVRAGPLAIIRAASELLTVDVREELQALNVPTLLVWGEFDTLVPLSIGYLVREEMKHARFLLLKRAGHVSMFDQYQQFNAAVLEFLRSCH